MTREQEDRRKELSLHLGNAFPDGYWNKFDSEFGHSFYGAHADRTLEYDQRLYEIISHKKVLEVGGFPGLEVAWLLKSGCEVDCIDSPDYRPDYYLDWCMENDVRSIPCDIVKDVSVCRENLPLIYDIALMSDVLLHVEGFPVEFMKWLCGTSKEIILINYPGDAKIVEAKGHNLKVGFHSIPSDDNLKEFMESNGAKFIETIEIESGKRHINRFKGKE